MLDLFLYFHASANDFGFGFGLDMRYWPRNNPWPIYLDARVVVDIGASHSDLQVYFTADSEGPWRSPFGIGDEVAILFPLELGLSLNLDSGEPDSMLFKGGVELVGEKAFVDIELSTNGDELVNITLEDFNLHKLVKAALCRSGGDCLGAVGDVLTAVSLERGSFFLHSQPKKEIVVNATLENLSLFGHLLVDKLEFELKEDTVKETLELTAELVLEKIEILHFFTLEATHGTKPCSKVWPDALRTDHNTTGAALLLHAGIDTSAENPKPPTVMFFFEGRLEVLGLAADACFEVSPTRIYANVELDIGSEVNATGHIDAAIAGHGEPFDFDFYAELNMTKLNHDIAQGVQDLTESIVTGVHEAADAAKNALHVAALKVQRVKAKLKAAQAALDGGFGHAISAVGGG